MTGKQIGAALGAGFLAGVLIYLYDVTVGPMIDSTVKGVAGSVGAKA